MYPAKLIRKESERNSFFGTVLGPSGAARSPADAPYPSTASTTSSVNERLPAYSPESTHSYFSPMGAGTFADDPIRRGLMDEQTADRIIDAVLIRLNTSYTPNGQFPVTDTVRGADGRETRIGYDGAVCLELYEPWVVETYNTTSGLGAPTSTRIVGKGAKVGSISNDEARSGDAVDLAKKGGVDMLNSTGLKEVYIVAHTNSVNQMVKVRALVPHNIL